MVMIIWYRRGNTTSYDYMVGRGNTTRYDYMVQKGEHYSL